MKGKGSRIGNQLTSLNGKVFFPACFIPFTLPSITTGTGKVTHGDFGEERMFCQYHAAVICAELAHCTLVLC
jgi:hypothetical protein